MILLKEIIKNAFTGTLYTLSLEAFKDILYRDKLDIKHLHLLKNAMQEHKEKIDKFTKVLNEEMKARNNKENETVNTSENEQTETKD